MRSQVATSSLQHVEPTEVLPKRSQIVTTSHGGRRYRPWAFTEHGAVMAANVLHSERAIHMSVFVVGPLFGCVNISLPIEPSSSAWPRSTRPCSSTIPPWSICTRNCSRCSNHLQMDPNDGSASSRREKHEAADRSTIREVAEVLLAHASDPNPLLSAQQTAGTEMIVTFLVHTTSGVKAGIDWRSIQNAQS